MGTLSANSSFSDIFDQDTPEFLEAIRTTIFPGEIVDLNASRGLKRKLSDETTQASNFSQELSLLSSQATEIDEPQGLENSAHKSKKVKVNDSREFIQGSSKQTPSSPTKKLSGKENKESAERNVPYTTDPATTEDARRIPGYAPHEVNAHAERLMQDPAFRAEHTSAAGAEFIEGFYQNSRLHHLSSWKAELKALVSEAQENAEKGFALGGDEPALSTSTEGKEDEDSGYVGKVDEDTNPGTSMRGNMFQLRSPSRNKSKGKSKDRNPGSEERVIMHCDFDCFFASVGLLSRPHLKDRPVVVCHSQGGQGGQASTSEVSSANYKARESGIRAGMRYGHRLLRGYHR